MHGYDWDTFDLEKLASELREDPGGAEGERMIWAFEEALRIARTGDDLLPHLLAATSTTIRYGLPSCRASQLSFSAIS